MTHFKLFDLSLVLPLLAFTLTGCGDDPVGAGGTGTAAFTSWGEEYIEEGIGPDPEGEVGFYDGWSVQYDKFLFTYHDIQVADQDGKVGAKQTGSLVVDNAVPGVKALLSFTELPAKGWSQVSYAVRPATASSVLIAGDPADLALMVERGLSVYVKGTATQGERRLTFAWGFGSSTEYRDCKSEVGGRTQLGIVIKPNVTDVSELTTHGDHLFYDRLRVSPNPSVPTRLRFEERAAADANGDGELTLEELDAAPIDVTKYDPSGLPATTYGGFMRQLVRSVGHFRGGGECTLLAVD